MAELRPRISGIELEVPVTANPRIEGDEFRFAREVAAKQCMPKYLGMFSGQWSYWLSNGMRAYRDQANFEVATGEDTSFRGTVTNERAAEQIAMECLEGWLHTQPEDSSQKLWLNKRMLDDNGTTMGYHINLSADTMVMDSRNQVLSLLALHLATQAPIVGAGGLLYPRRRNEQVRYTFAQKIPSLTCDFDRQTVHRKPLVNLRDEGHTGNGEYKLARVHITSTDANVSDWASMMNLGMASLVLRIGEQGLFDPKSVQLAGTRKDPYTALAKQTAYDLDFTETTEMADGRTMDALDIQEMLIELAEKTHRTDEEDDVLQEWKRAVGDLNEDPMLLRNRSGGMAKLAIMRSKMARLGLSAHDFDHPELKAIDLLFDTLSIHEYGAVPRTAEARIHPSYQESFVKEKLRNGWFGNHAIPDEAVLKAMVEAPSTTRASIRAAAILGGDVRRVAWDSYNTASVNRVVKLRNPYQTLSDLEAS